MRGSCTIVLLLSIGLMTGCEKRQPDIPAASPNSGKAAPASGKVLRSLNEAQRDATLFRAIHDAGQRCDKVDRSALQQTFKGMDMWVSHCTASGDWAVFVNAQGYAQVSLCPATPTAGLPSCTALRAAPSNASAARAPS